MLPTNTEYFEYFYIFVLLHLIDPLDSGGH